MTVIPLSGLSAKAAPTATALEQLASRSVLLAGLVDACSRRRDVRQIRAQIVLLLLRLACPLHGRPARSWYVPGAVARLGAEGLLRAWRGFTGEDPPCLRSMRSHLGALEQAGILQRGPGDWLPVRRDPDHPERRPRFPDTFHVLDGEAASEFWAGPGSRLLDLHPEARHSPDVWKKLFGGWRSGVVQHVLALEGAIGARSAPRAAANPEDVAEARRRGAELGRALVRARDPLAVLSGLAVAGVVLKGPGSFKAAGAWPRLRACGAMLARALSRGDRVRNPAGWIWRALESAQPHELASARAWLGDEPEGGREMGWRGRSRPPGGSSGIIGLPQGDKEPPHGGLLSGPGA